MSRRLFQKFAELQGALENALQSGRCTVSGHAPVRWYYRDSRGYEHFERQTNFTSGNSLYYTAGAAAAFGVYYASCREEIPYTHRKHAVLFVTKRYEQTIGKLMFDQIKAEAQQQGTLLPDDHPYTRTVRRIGKKIAAVTTDGQGGGRIDHMKDLDWEFAVIASDQVNAFVLPGGKVVVFTGLMQLLSTEDELASVLGHEAGHVVARHQAERMSMASLFSLAQLAVYLTIGLRLPDLAFQLGIFLPYSRRAEVEADLIGLQLVARACYDPTASTTMLEKLHQMEHEHELKTGRSIPGFLRTHPLGTDRVKSVEGHLPAAVTAFHNAGCEEAHSWMGSVSKQLLHHAPRHGPGSGHQH